MQIASGLVTGLNLILGLVVGLRLLRQSGGRAASPELPLAVYFLLSSVISSALMVLAYGSLADPALEALVPLRRTLLGSSTLLMHVGVAGVYVFTVRTFRPGQAWARALAAAGIALMAVGTGIEGFAEGFALRIDPGPGHWIGWFGRTSAFVWVSWEALAFWRQMRRREALGLADPVLTNRFLLWGVWSATSFLLFAADLIARVLYRALAGTTEIVLPVLQPCVAGTVAATMLIGMLSAVTLFLTFFPTPAYRRWLARRRPQGA